MGDIDATLEKQIFDLSQRKRIADVHHHREADHLGRTVEITEWIFHPQRLRAKPAGLNPICSDTAVGCVQAWWLLAELGNADLQYNLGVMYDKGQGVPQDYIFAHMWYSLGAANGNKVAAKNRGTLAKRMTPVQIAEAQKLAREWWAKHKKK